MMKRFLLATVVGAGLLGTGPLAYAQMSPRAFLAAVDKDNDGTVTLDEVKAYAAEKFAALEKDKDGTLDKKELKGRLSAAGMKDADPDSDKTVDQNEFMAYVEKLFKEANDNDATLDAKELASPAGKKLLKLLK
jgi:Ca2+-binding EF-hand superfamily protein